jgi:glutathione S-transferase
MKLYFSPGACSLSPHIVLREGGFDFELEQVHLGSHKTKSGVDYLTINPKGYVPALKLDDGQVLTEGPAIVQYLADQKPSQELAPPNGTIERYRLQEWLNFISTEIHKAFSPLFNPHTPEETKKLNTERLQKRFDYVNKELGSKAYLMGDTFTVADAYLFTVLQWAKPMKIDLQPYPKITAYIERVHNRAAVKAALEAETAARG